MSHFDDFEDDGKLSGRMDFGLWRRFIRFGQPHVRWFAALFVVALFTAMLEVAMPIYVGHVIDAVKAAAERGEPLPLGLYGGVYAGMITAFSALIFALIYVCGGIVTRVSRDIRRATFAHLQALDIGYFSSKPVGWLMSRLTGDTALLSRVMGWALLDIVWGGLMLLGISVAMLILDWQLALVLMVVVPLLLIASRWFQWRLLITSRRVRKDSSHLTAAFNEGLMGVRTTKAMSREAENLDEFGEQATKMYDDSVIHGLYAAALWPVVSTVCAVSIGLVLWYGGLKTLGVDNTFSLGKLVQFLGLATLFTHPIQELSHAITMVLGAQASAERIQQVLDTEPKVKDGDEPFVPEGSEAVIASIACRDLGFAYDEGRPVLQGVDFTAKAGQTIALVGETGGGKSTLVSLLCRYYDPTDGQVLINGKDARDYSLDWLQSQIGTVPQAPQLFTGTVRENIRYGRLDATDAEVEQAAHNVQAHAFIQDLPGAYEAKVGQGGCQLSTGQKQLIALARLVLADPQVFVMDEATSSVDTQTEQWIQTAIDAALENRMAFVIAHRLSTIRKADQILVIDAGEIVESGTHEALMASGGRYHGLYTKQYVADAEQAVLAD